LNSRALQWTIAALGSSQILISIWMVAAPESFFEHVGPFGTYNSHYLGDVAAFQAGIGVALLASLRWPALQAGALAAMLAAVGLHLVNHIVDVGDAHTGSDAGVLDVITVGALFLVVAYVLQATLKEGHA
jgi:predicted anti-sigma-YlaC factor YlaD